MPGRSRVTSSHCGVRAHQYNGTSMQYYEERYMNRKAMFNDLSKTELCFIHLTKLKKN